MRRKRIIVSIVLLSVAFWVMGCAADRGQDDTQTLSEWNHRVVETVLENDESGGTVEESDVVIDQTFYGSFSQPEAKEALAICRILDTPHTGGLDRRAIVILTVDSMEVVAYDEIAADEVWIHTLPLSNGQDRVIFSGKSTFQGIPSQEVMYYCVQNGQWVETPIEELELPGEEQFYFLTGDVMIVTSAGELTDTSDITAILAWDQEVGRFIAKQSAGNLNALSESEIVGFNTGFFNSEADIMNNMLLSSEYDDPREIDLFQLFYNGIGGADQISAEELALLTELDSMAPDLDVVRITADEMEVFLQEKLGIGLEESNKKGLENFYFLPQYDSYYVIAGDTNYEHCTVFSGFWETDDRLRLEYGRESGEGHWKVTLQKARDGYQFVSNARVD
ncbi:MAG: hypothetical protein NC245_08730 [Muribaculum sp.]|nr:hypothetical protein [Muribaculum sp.]